MNINEEDDNNDEFDIIDEYTSQTINEHKTFFERFQYLIPVQTRIYIQYCLLRVPFLLLYDYLFTEQFYYSIEALLQNSVAVLTLENHFLYKPIIRIIDSYLFQILISINLMLSIPVLGLILLTILLLCSDRRLVILYSYTISYLVIYFFYQINRLPNIQINTIILQFILSFIYIYMLNKRRYVYTHIIQKRLCYIALGLYIITRYLFPLKLSIYVLNIFYLFWLLIHLSELIIYQRNLLINSIKIEYLHELINLYENFGFQTLINYIQDHIHITTLLKIFWLTKICILPLGLRTIYANPYITNEDETNITQYNETLITTIYFTTIYYSTETVFTLISLACIVSSGMKLISHRLFHLLHLWNEEVEQIGTVIGIMFFLLFQSNLTKVDLNRRHIPLLKAFCLLIVALIHFIHTNLEPQLLKVAMQTMAINMTSKPTDENRSMPKSSYFSPKILHSFHHRYIYICLSILVLLVLYIIILWHVTSFSTWLLAITAFLLELIIRHIASLAQYTIYVLDAHNCLSNIDSFDDNIFLIKAITSVFEFILGVFLLLNGLYILCFEARGALRAFMLAIHAHLNIIKNLTRGWQIFRNRRSAWDNVNKLPLATEEQIENYNDICSICHNKLTIGKTCITPCLHFFHQKCLQKVFYATHNCALCSRPIF